MATIFERDVLMLLGELKQGQSRLREDFDDEKRLAHASRQGIYQRLEEGVRATADLRAELKLNTAETRQTRTKIEKEVMPAVRTINGLKLQGAAIITAAAVIGGGLTALASTQGGAFWKWLQGIFT